MNRFVQTVYLQKLLVHFSKFTVVGIVVIVLQVFSIWVLVDVIGANTFISTTMVVIAIFLLKFYLYKIIGLISRQFLKYTFIQVLSAILSIVLIWFAIDILHIQTVIATSSVVVFLFLVRFFMFRVLKLIAD